VLSKKFGSREEQWHGPANGAGWPRAAAWWNLQVLKPHRPTARRQRGLAWLGSELKKPVFAFGFRRRPPGWWAAGKSPLPGPGVAAGGSGTLMLHAAGESHPGGATRPLRWEW